MSLLQRQKQQPILMQGLKVYCNLVTTDLIQTLTRFPGFGWGRVDFIHSGWYGPVVWISAEQC